MGEAKIIQLKKGETLMCEGTYTVLSGNLICKTCKQLIHFLNIGDILIVDVTFFENNLCYEARGKVLLVDVTKNRAFNVLKTRQELQKKITKALLKRVDSYSSSAKDRLKSLLYQAGDETGKQHITEDICQLPNLLTHRELAQYVGCSREYLSGLRKELIKDGSLSNSKGWILLSWSKWQAEFRY
ncbi:Crp/Fnr family transcriptional regulator [Listeria rustica]|uniref:Crp/Fnr family transcriptional regulator n=1 Tax=Listeria rustica TaxID=2713503 RepID=A0A7W1T9D2_9LIST|nr:Crp/Fnr family transcriptional regulator [Listeria rustica]MBA3927907.1 Crp/Fnr family transcriptional regulator [Listeria rustica]